MENGKELEVLQKEVTDVETRIGSLVIVTKEDYQNAINFGNKIKEVKQGWIAYWKDTKELAHSAWKNVVAKEKEKVDVCDKALKLVNDKTLAWEEEANRIKIEEERRLNAEEEERKRREREAAIKAAEKLKTPELKAARLEEAEQIQHTEIILEKPTYGVVGAITKTTWKGEVTDISMLIAAAKPGTVAAGLLEVNEKALRSLAISTKGRVTVPGVKFTEVKFRG
jgi:ABC-type proline/glycine betaine transport system ATPase subunit